MNDYYLLDFNFDFHENIIALDMDNTIISTKSGKKFPIDKDDWKFIFDSNIKLIKENKKNKSIIIITNQLGIDKGKTNLDDIKDKLYEIQKHLNIPILAIIANKNNIYRKPRIGSFELLYKLYNDKDKNIKKFTFIGDAAGRLKDHSDSDYKYLLNIKKFVKLNNLSIKTSFKLPEEYFMNKNTNVKFDNNISIKGYKLNYKGNDTFKTIINRIEAKMKKDMNHIFLVSGYPSSGKTTLSNQLKTHFNVEHISKDIYKGKFKKIITNNVNKSNDIIIEGLYYSEKQRNELKNLINDKYKIINIICDVDIETAIHFNNYRSLTTGSDIIPNIVYYSYRKYYTDNSDYNIIKVKPKIINKNINNYYLI